MKEPILQNEIRKLADAAVPMHMPGHKRKVMPSRLLPYELDITEIEGADDLHGASGILKEAMDRASALWGSGRTWFLVGGSTCGILSAVRAAAPFGSEIIAARNCHRSVYHAIELGGYRVHWIIPKRNREFDICLGITAREVRDALRKHPGSKAVVITSPTYEGILSDVRGIASVCKEAEVPLITDEAHGAHLGLFEEGGFPQGAVSCGSDLVIQSVHKTLPSLTQTAVLHLQGNLVTEKEMERQLGIFETSSPSYPLMISIDSCVQLLSEDGASLFAEWKRGLDRFYKSVEGLDCIRVLQDGSIRGSGGPNGVRDRSKILINFGRAGLSGARAAAILRERFGIETEMSSGANVLAMTGCGDREEDFARLSDAILKMEEALRGRENGSSRRSAAASLPRIHAACTILDAVLSPGEEVPAASCEGRICGEYLYAYPPGVPILAPGEYIGREHLRIIRQKTAERNPVHHTHAQGRDTIFCLAE